MKERIETTEAYLALDKLKQSLVRMRNGRTEIEHGYSVAKNLGFEQYKKQTKYNPIVFAIVDELLKQDKL